MFSQRKFELSVLKAPEPSNSVEIFRKLGLLQIKNFIKFGSQISPRYEKTDNFFRERICNGNLKFGDFERLKQCRFDFSFYYKFSSFRIIF